MEMKILKKKSATLIVVIIALFLCFSNSMLLERKDALADSNLEHSNGEQIVDIDENFDYVSSSSVVGVSDNNAVLTETPPMTNYNIVKNNYYTGNIEYNNFANSMANADVSLSPSSQTSSTYDLESLIEGQLPISNDFSPIDNTEDNITPVSNMNAMPYNNVALIHSFFYDESKIVCGTAFFQGEKMLVTAGHCIYCDITDDNIYNPTFPDYIQVYPQAYANSDNEIVAPYGIFYVSGAYIQKEYYLNPSLEFDWGAVLIDFPIGDNIGAYGKWNSYTASNNECKLVGYPGGDFYLSKMMCYSTGNFISQNTCYETNAEVIGGMSGGPILVNVDDFWYAVGIITYKTNSSSGGTIFNNFIYNFLNSLITTNGVEIRDFYFEGTNHYKYNTMVSAIMKPETGKYLYLSSNGNTYDRVLTGLSTEFYSSSTSSTTAQIPFNYFKNYNISTQNFTSPIELCEQFNDDELSAKYPIKLKTNVGTILTTSFDSASNLFVHGGSVGKTIKGTIAYNGKAKNIEVVIPFWGANYSSVVEINGVTFQLSCAMKRVSIRSSKQVICDDKTCSFSFAIV